MSEDKQLSPTQALLALFKKTNTPNAVKGFNGVPGSRTKEQLVEELRDIRQVMNGLKNREKLLGEVLQTVLKAENPDWISSIDVALEKGELPSEEVMNKKVDLPGGWGQFVFVGQRRLSVAALEEKFGPEWVEDNKVVIGFYQIKFGKAGRGGGDDE